ncbi:MAG: MarR family winged helix-turn-helix transcriptional regulator [Phycisphaeraceae bacterium]
MKHLAQATVKGGRSAEDCAKTFMESIPVLMQHVKQTAHRQRGPRLSVPQFRAMAYLRRQPDASLSALAEYLGLSLPTVSRTVETLVCRKLVSREPLPRSRRQLRLRLSNSGSQLLETALAQTRQRLADQFEQFSPKQRGRIIQSLQVLCESVRHPTPTQ